MNCIIEYIPYNDIVNNIEFETNFGCVELTLKEFIEFAKTLKI